jgi:hypothetical protein
MWEASRKITAELKQFWCKNRIQTRHNLRIAPDRFKAIVAGGGRVQVLALRWGKTGCMGGKAGPAFKDCEIAA